MGKRILSGNDRSTGGQYLPHRHISNLCLVLVVISVGESSPKAKPKVKAGSTLNLSTYHRPGREGMGMGIGHLLGSEEVGLRTQSAISRDQPPGLRLSCQVQKYLPSLSKEDVIDMSEHMFSRHPE